ncbi:ATP-binding cassette domain-containing protein [Alkalibaculum sp. M08DMB]|uniref:ATP-binding cassette domain-containing protein n=1 Tax=Alkalibaculum sporogenes TaxID=2655001 RepID=A0A6A7K9Y4_9FIRM|nr:ATP-binding cassette domain-containing protein [Alkalibaculum sporogenes]MPW26182.1 ATP-binding cassette domain-containing protein [Alkalibaculum sporogenes]
MKEKIIEIVDLTKTFTTKDGEIKALDNINLTIHKGDIFGIIGMSGAGKSTLVRCINFLEVPTEGTVIVDNKNLATLNNKRLRELRRTMGMIFQQFNLLMQKTVIENICFPLEISGVSKSDSKIRAKELLELVGLKDKENAYPSQLSGGQKQRVAIARALSTNPKVLLCDEATSALDPNTTRSILELLKDINKTLNITIVIITHEMAVIEEICSHVAIIDESKIAETGRVQDIFTHPKTAPAQRLVYPQGTRVEEYLSKRCCRIVFDGSSSYDPVISQMILACKTPINILFADMKDIEGKAFGQMVIQLPSDEVLADKVVRYLHSRNLAVEEVDNYVE